MPWKSTEAKGHTKSANTPKKRDQWATVANKILKESGDEGKAVRIANAAVGDRFWKGNTFLADKFGVYLRRVTDGKKIRRTNAKGEEEGYFEEEDSKNSLIADSDEDDDENCPDCDGTGEYENGDECETCEGSGKIDSDDDDDDLKRDHIKRPTIRMYDNIDFKDAKVRQLENGYVSAMPRIARTGVQIYGGDECGRDDMDMVRVFRPDAEVFHKDAVHSYTHLPVTLDHPTVPVTADNWKKYAVGETGDEVLRDGTSIRVPMMLRDAEAIKAYKAGTNQLSVGYDCDLIWEDGVTDSGEQYDAIQHGIRANHLAVVAAARGGSTLKIGDEGNHGSKGETTMNIKTILVDGLEVQVPDTAATIIQRALSTAQDSLKEMRDKFKKKEEDDEDRDDEDTKKDAAIKKLDEAVKAKDKELDTKNGEIAALKAQVSDAEKKASPAAIDAAARERAGVISKAHTIMGGKLKTDGLMVTDIRRNVVEARLNCKDWSDDRISGAFEAMQTPNSFSQDRRQTQDTTMEDAVRVFGKPGQGYQTPSELRDKAYGDYDAEVSNAWRGKQSA